MIPYAHAIGISMKGILKKISITLNFITAFSFLVLVFSYFQIMGLPSKEEILDVLFQEPSQAESLENPFDFHYEGSTYTIVPLYDYEIHGLVVSHNNISSVMDSYHTSQSVDFRDLCVIWGDNFDNNIHNKISFWSEPWTCNYQSPSSEVGSQFRSDHLSNNHLLSDNRYLRDKILRAKVGDQIRLSGKLVNYYPKRFKDLSRNTSVVRTDTGNGACEVVFVENFDILNVWQKSWSKLYYFFKSFFVFLICVKTISFFTFPYLEYVSNGD